ncbi:MAG TPA: aminomethyltransferase family protein [Actinomycetota bacterium]|nr:aminomethyltransferase family protein [Actinomycetota bacterium]
MSVGTAFHPRTSQLNSKMSWGEWSGYFAAAVYADFHDIEYNAIREQAALIDVSPLYKYEITGPDAARLVDRVMTRDVAKLAVDRVFYTPWCNEDGKVIDDGTVTRRGENEFFWTAADPTYRWFHLNASGLDVRIEDVSEKIAGVALQGPRSRMILEAVTRQDWADVRYFGHRRTEIGGIDVHVTRTGYTGDLGYEVWTPEDQAVEVWDALWEAGGPHGIRPAGIRALDVSRVEAGLILIEAEYTSARHAISSEQQYSPFEIGLGRLVDFGKRAFVGRHALQLEQRRGGPARRLVGLDLDWSGIEAMYARHDLPPGVSATVQRDAVPVSKDGKQVGRATSIGWGPTIKKMVGFGSVPPSLSAPGTRLSVEWSVEGERGRVGATVVELPFLDLERKRS